MNCVAPGPIDTDIMGGTLTEERKAALGADGMVGRVGTVAEVACWPSCSGGRLLHRTDYDINGGLQVS